MSDIRITVTEQGSKISPEILEIYHEAFPPDQRKNDAAFQDIIESPKYLLLIAYDRTRPIGFAATKKIDSDIALLEYMAVDEKYRNLGLGGNLFDRTTRVIRGHDRTLILEVDKGGETPEEISFNARRKRFYARHGCKLAKDLGYILPLGSHKGTPMDIMVWSITDRRCVENATMLSWIARIYINVYGVDENDYRLIQMFDNIQDRIYLEG